MKNLYFKLLLCISMMMTAGSASAIVKPNMGHTLTDGESYVLVNYAVPNGYMNRTSWDGAFRFASYQEFNFANVALTAHHYEGDVWYFTLTSAPTNYFGTLAGTDNLNAKAEDPAYFIVEQSDVTGFYRLKAGEEQLNEYCIGRYMHLNRTGEYVVISEPTNSWYPDFYGGVEEDVDEDGSTYMVQDENGEYIPKSHESEMWAFLLEEDMAAYHDQVEAYVSIVSLQADGILEDAVYGEGMTKTLEKATALYENGTSEDYVEVVALINAKYALLTRINEAQATVDETDDQTLQEAVDAAVASLSTAETSAAVKEADDALAAAQRNHDMGLGDLTRLGSNMSFEDLSAQNGLTSTGVENPPAGWNLYVNGTLVTSKAEMNAAGLSAWAAINGDGTGEKDGDMIWGIWNGSMPDVELSQTLTGLNNGTYTITAAVMVGANWAGSRMTTQRLFANLNSKYFGSESDYNVSLLDENEVFGFEGLTEPNTDTELQPMSVSAFVYDGTLTFGFRTDGRFAAANRTQ